MTAPDLHRVGSRGLLIDLPTLADVMNWHADLRANPLDGQVDVIAAARTVLILFASPGAARAAAEELPAYEPAAMSVADAKEVTLDVVYDGEDVAEVAGELSLGADALIDWHTRTVWKGAFGGFAPGFTYCVPADDAEIKRVNRRSSPRPSVPERAVGLADDFSAVYPRTSPGGWRLIGTANQALWDASKENPSLIAPGDTVRYRQVRERVEVVKTAPTSGAEPSLPALTIMDPGLLTVIEDRGRPGHGSLGVTDSGTADRENAAGANLAVGNDFATPVLENIGGMQLSALVETVIAVTGAAAALTVNGREKPLSTPVLVVAGDEITVEPPNVGMRSYLALRSGIAAEQVLGSSSYDALAGIGPAPLKSGDTIKMRRARPGVVDTTVTNAVRVRLRDARTQGVLRCVPGPRADWFLGGLPTLEQTPWTVTPHSNRVGLRLEGADGVTIERTREGELPSEGMVAGSVQIPPNGQPVVFLRDHPITGGYPVIATVVPEDIDIAGQLPPGGTVKFVLVDPDTLAPLTTDTFAHHPHANGGAS